MRVKGRGETMNEKLSAFLDNQLSELEERRLLVELGRDPSLRDTWGRYHLIRAALRRELDHAGPLSVADAVAGALDGEPDHQRRRFYTIGKAVGGFAIAASVATFAILNMPTSRVAPSNGPAAAVAQNSATATTPAAASAASQSLNAYLLEHSEFAQTPGMGNVLPYVRTVNHENGR